MDQKELEDGEVIDGESDEELSVLKIVPPDRFKNFNWEQNTQEFERDCVKYKNRQKRSSFSSNSSLDRFIEGVSNNSKMSKMESENLRPKRPIKLSKLEEMVEIYEIDVSEELYMAKKTKTCNSQEDFEGILIIFCASWA